jgi:hypothetical protein
MIATENLPNEKLAAPDLRSSSKTREDVKTWTDLLDLDDFVTFGGNP